VLEMVKGNLENTLVGKYEELMREFEGKR